jgi:hypothetical protein
MRTRTGTMLDAEGALLRDIKLPEIAVSLFKERSGELTLFDNGRAAIDGVRKMWDEKTILLLAEDGSLIRRAVTCRASSASINEAALRDRAD